MGETSRVVCSIIACVLCVITIALTVSAIPVDAFKDRATGTACFSMWGAKTCGTHGLTPSLELDGFPCEDVRKKMVAGASCAIAGAVTAFIALVLHFLQVFKVWSPMPGVCGIVVAYATWVLVLVAWVQVVSSLDRKCPVGEDDYKLHTDYKLATAFPLLLVAWILQTVNFVFIGCGW